MKFFRLKLLAIWEILRRRHWFLVSLPTSELEQSFLGDDFEAGIITHRLQHYNVRHFSSIIARGFDQEGELEAFRGEVRARYGLEKEPDWELELQKALAEENYERAAMIRDRLK